jgi:hypothetical protein
MPSSLASTPSTRSNQSDNKTASTLSGKSDDLGTTRPHLKHDLWDNEKLTSPAIDGAPVVSLGAIQHLDRQGKVIGASSLHPRDASSE